MMHWAKINSPLKAHTGAIELDRTDLTSEEPDVADF
jgi:hypothetical protein